MYVHGDPVNGIDPTGEFFTAIGQGIVSSVQSVMRNSHVATALVVYDRLSTIIDVAKILGQFAAAGTVNPALLAGLLISQAPFGAILKKARPAFNVVGDLTYFLTHGGAGYIDEAAEALTDIYGALSKTAGLSVEQAAKHVGEIGAISAAKKLGMEAIEEFPARYHGIDGLFKHGDTIVIVEAKGGAGELGETLAGQQMSQGWIDDKITKLIGNGDPQINRWGEELLVARNSGKLQGMVVKTKITDEGVRAPAFELKNFNEIGPATW